MSKQVQLDMAELGRSERFLGAVREGEPCEVRTPCYIQRSQMLSAPYEMTDGSVCQLCGVELNVLQFFTHLSYVYHKLVPDIVSKMKVRETRFELPDYHLELS